jgi:hypothetical protein
MELNGQFVEAPFSPDSGDDIPVQAIQCDIVSEYFISLLEGCLNGVKPEWLHITWAGKGASAAGLKKKLVCFETQLVGATVTFGSGDENVSFRQESEEIDKASVLVKVRPLPIGFVVTRRTPMTRADSYPVRTDAANWFEKLGQSAFSSLCCREAEEFKVGLEASWRCGAIDSTDDLFGCENRFVEYKLLDDLTKIKGSIIGDYLYDSFTPCLNSSSQEVNAAHIWFGILDDPRVPIGLPTVWSYRAILIEVIASWAAQILPALHPNSLTVTEYAIIGTGLSDWKSYCSMRMKEDEARCALHCLLGKASVRENTDDPEYKYEVFADSETVTLLWPHLKNIRSDVNYCCSDSQVERCIKYCRSLFPKKSHHKPVPPSSFDWIEREWTPGSGNTSLDPLPRRAAFQLTVKLRNDMSGIVCNSKEDKSDIRVVGFNENACFDLLPWQIWARSKGWHHGVLSPLRAPLISVANRKVLFMTAGEDLNTIQDILGGYLDFDIDIDCIVSSTLFNHEYISALKFSAKILFITTFAARNLCVEFARAIDGPGKAPVRCLVMSPLEKCSMSFRNAFQFDPTRVSVDDMVLLVPCSRKRAYMRNGVRCIPPVVVADEALAQEYYLGKLKVVPMELAQHGWIADTTNILNCFRLVIAAPKSKLSVLRVLKRFDGSGATTLLAGVGWKLTQIQVSCVFFQRPYNKEKFWQQFRTDAAHAILVDDAEYFPEELIDSVPMGLSVVIIQVVLTKPCQLVLDPFLSIDDLSLIIPKLQLYIPQSKDALSQLYNFVGRNKTAKEDRHIYVVMHVAATKKFEPVSKFLHRMYQEMKDDRTRQISVFLAVLSAFSGGKGIPMNMIPDTVQLDLLNDITTCREGTLRFLHPFVANLFLQLVLHESAASSSAATPPRIERIWSLCELAIANLAVIQAPFTDMIRCLFMNRCSSFSPFVYRIIRVCGVTSLNNILISRSVKDIIFGGHADILLSRVFRLLQKDHVQSLASAESACEKLENSEFCYLALNNKGCSQGYYAFRIKDSDNSAMLASMRKTFDELERAGKDSESKDHRERRVLRVRRQREFWEVKCLGSFAGRMASANTSYHQFLELHETEYGGESSQDETE